MLRKFHQAPGLVAAILVIVMAMTGAVLCLNPALERLHATIPGAGAVNVATLASKVAVTFPGVERIVRKPSGAIVVSYFDPDKPGVALVDPATGAANGNYAPSPFTTFVTNLHRNLLLGDAGRLTAGLGAGAMLALSVSGMMLLSRQVGGWRALLRPIRGTRRARLHGEIGRIAVAGLCLSSATGLFLSLTTFGILPEGSAPEVRPPASSTAAPPMAVGDMAALRTIDLSALRELSFPYAGDPTDVFTVTTSDGSGFVDQSTGAFLSFRRNGLAQTIHETMFMLHTGEGLWWLALILGLSALSVPFMSATGVMIYVARRRAMPRIACNVGAERADTVILVGSENNSTFGFAANLHAALTATGLNVHMAPMNRFSPALAKAETLIVLTATHGHGEAPACARNFLARLARLEAVAPTRVAVLGFGDRQFPRFCGYAEDVAAGFVERGFATLLPLVSIDRQSPQAFAEWGRQLGDAMGVALMLDHTPLVPRTTALALVGRTEYGADLQVPAAVLQFALGGRARSFRSRFRRQQLARFAPGDLVGIVAPGSVTPRYYSLASSRSDGVLEICVRRQPGGLCSGFLTGLRIGDTIDAFVRGNPGFRPLKGKAPVILIGAGTGVGPLAGFIRHNRRLRPMHLYFGARDPQSDYFYEAELKACLADGRLTKLVTAFSRIEGRAYVQDRLLADAAALSALVAGGAQIMVCGGRAMGAGVSDAFRRILTPIGLSVEDLKAKGRYLEDVY